MHVWKKVLFLEIQTGLYKGIGNNGKLLDVGYRSNERRWKSIVHELGFEK